MSVLLLHLENCSVFSLTVCSLLHCITKVAKPSQESLEECDVI